MTVQPNGGRGGWIIADLQEFDVILWKSKYPGICLSCSHNSYRGWCWHPIMFLLLADALSISNEIGPSSWMAIAIFKAAPKQNNICLRVWHAVAYYAVNAFRMYPHMRLCFPNPHQSDYDICGLCEYSHTGCPKKRTFRMLLEPQCTGSSTNNRNKTPCVWKLIFGSFLTKTKPDQAFPNHVHGKI